MLNTSTKLSILAMLGVGLVIGKAANADTITQTFTIPTHSVPFTNPFTFNLFDTTLGTLNSISIYLGTSATAEVDISNQTGASQLFSNAMATIPVIVTGPAAVTVSNTLVAGPFAGTVTPGNSAFPGLTTSNNNTVNVPLIDFSSYEGMGIGTSSLTASASAGTYSGSSVPFVFFGGSGTASGTVILTYNYTGPVATPEPGFWGFMVAGASTGLVLVRRRRRK